MEAGKQSRKLGWSIPDFRLPATDGETYGPDDLSGQNGLVVAFICNHCPYVVAALPRMIRDARELDSYGVGFAAVCSNDANTYPADSFEKMTELAEAQGWPFPYLHDASQSLAKTFDAEATPEFFGFDAEGRLRYHGRLDGAGTGDLDDDAPRELFEAMVAVSKDQRPKGEQMNAIGCSIKWKR